MTTLADECSASVYTTLRARNESEPDSTVATGVPARRIEAESRGALARSKVGPAIAVKTGRESIGAVAARSAGQTPAAGFGAFPRRVVGGGVVCEKRNRFVDPRLEISRDTVIERRGLTLRDPSPPRSRRRRSVRQRMSASSHRSKIGTPGRSPGTPIVAAPDRRSGIDHSMRGNVIESLRTAEGHVRTC